MRRRLLRLFAGALRLARSAAHLVIPHGASPKFWRRLVPSLERRLIYDDRTQTVTVTNGPLAGMKKFGPFADADAAFALGTYEPQISAVLRKHCRPGATVFDIGANVGYHTLLLSQVVGEQGQVHAFEPVPETAASLEQTVALNRLANVTVHGLAVGDRMGTVSMRYGDASEAGRAHIVGVPGYRWDAATGTSQLVEVPIVSIDGLHETGELPLPSLIKLDVEGAELQALRGMRQVLSAAHPVIVAELWGEENVAAVHELLGSLGYEVTVLSEWHGMVAGEPATTRDVLATPR